MRWNVRGSGSLSGGAPDAADVSAVLERTHLQLVELSVRRRRARRGPAPQVVDAVREGVRREAAPMGRQVAEVRGLAVQLLRRLERLETDLAAERHARVDDLGLLVDLIGAGWQSVDERLARIEQAHTRQRCTAWATAAQTHRASP